MFVKLTSLDQSNGILLKYQSIPLRHKKFMVILATCT